ncbi:hypothetical protein [Rhizorhabdus phycosphaerae]|uniref:hypothetical protein n=1 Tax=Rhizorhabdus phycosphaerae TaxID=2711156 RepID=UPI0019D0D5DF|nr:hypothetical protein [Rhizorhabdus phycosphaerae]
MAFLVSRRVRHGRRLPLLVGLMLASSLSGEVPLDVGQTATIRSSPQRELVYPVAPPLTQAPANRGALLAVDIDEPGRYRLSLDADAWIDVLLDGRALPVAAHDAPRAGSNERKALLFDLAPGPHGIALSGLSVPAVDVRIERVTTP